MEAKYCPLCRSELERRMVDGTSRLACSSSACRFVHWNNPIPVVAALVQCEGQYLLGRNAGWPANLFSLFTGFLDGGESPEAAAVREVSEELGLRAERTEFIGHFPLPQFNQLLIAYFLEARGVPKLNHEIAEIKAVSPADLGRFDFGPLELTRTIVGHWLERTRT